jgi:hypothetical protein
MNERGLLSGAAGDCDEDDERGEGRYESNEAHEDHKRCGESIRLEIHCAERLSWLGGCNFFFDLSFLKME